MVTFHKALLFVSYIFTIVVAFQVSKEFVSVMYVDNRIISCRVPLCSLCSSSFQNRYAILAVTVILWDKSLCVGTSCYEEMPGPKCDHEVRLPQRSFVRVYTNHCKPLLSGKATISLLVSFPLCSMQVMHTNIQVPQHQRVQLPRASN